MRIVIAFAAILALGLAGCGQRPGRNEQVARNDSGGLPVPGPRPVDNGTSGLSTDQAFRQSYRTTAIEGCINAAQNRAAQGGGAAPGTDFRPACTCYIDRSMAGLTVQQLSDLQPGPREQDILEQCAQENGLRTDNGGGK
jgi:hypothetical protein